MDAPDDSPGFRVENQQAGATIPPVNSGPIRSGFVERLLSPQSLQRMMACGGALLILGMVAWLWSIGLFANPVVVAILIGTASLSTIVAGVGLGEIYQPRAGGPRIGASGRTCSAAQPLVLRRSGPDHSGARRSSLDSGGRMLRDLRSDRVGTPQCRICVRVCGRHCVDRNVVSGRQIRRSVLVTDASGDVSRFGRMGMRCGFPTVPGRRWRFFASDVRSNVSAIRHDGDNSGPHDFGRRPAVHDRECLHSAGGSACALRPIRHTKCGLWESCLRQRSAWRSNMRLAEPTDATELRQRE